MTATFTITTKRSSENLYLYPNAAGNMTQLTSSGGANYTCIDEERLDYDDDTSYVYNFAVSVASDIYIIPDHTTESGAINYVQVYGRAKAHSYGPSSVATYKLLVQVGSTATKKSTNFNLSNTYNPFTYIWTSQPTDSTIWSWNAIDNLKIGVECSSPSIIDATQTLTLRPNAYGGKSDATIYGSGTTNYESVDEITSDSDNTHNWFQSGSGWNEGNYDLYNIEDHTTQTGTITNVTVYGTFRGSTAAGTPTMTLGISEGGTLTWGTAKPIHSSYQLYSETWTTNPRTAAAWAWASIDDLEIGWTGECPGPITYKVRCTQMYAVVSYYNSSSPQIRTTQVYAKVNYVPSTNTFYLNKPVSIEKTNKREVRTENFWDGSRSIWDVKRSQKGLHMSGFEEGSAGETRLNNIFTTLNYTDFVSITGLDSTLYDTDYFIQDFSFRREASQPTIYWWDMILEEY